MNLLNSVEKKVLEEILKEREKTIYYSVICDATPDISHMEQNVILLRYVANKEDDQWEIIERFLQFKAFNGKTGREISEMILKTLEEHSIDISDCRGQGFDNGANMSGKVKGVQAEIKKINPLATYSPCASHSLNLVGVQAAESCPDVSTFFGCLNRLYNLFSASPERWCSLQRLSETRWSARIAAVKPVANHLPSIIEALDTILAKCSLTNEARSEASGLKQYFMSFKAIVLLTVWKKILQSIEDRNLILQSGKISIEVEIDNIRALKEEMEVLRNSWDNLFAEASLIAEAMDVPKGFPVSHKRKRKRFADESQSSEDAKQLETEEIRFRNDVFFVALDNIISALDIRFQTTAKIYEEFFAILKLKDLKEDQIHPACHSLVSKYTQDLTTGFENEVRHLKSVYKATFADCQSPLDLLNSIYRMQLQSIFGEVCVAVRIFCTLPVSVSGAERAFSKLKLVKNYLRSTQTQERFNSLARLSIESQLSRQLDFKDLISDFANKKVRQWDFGSS